VSDETEERGGADLRLPLLGLAAWAGGLAGHLLPVLATMAGVAGAVVGLLMVRRRLRGRGAVTLGGLLLVFVAVAASAVLRQQQVEDSPVAALAAQRAVATLELTVTADPRVIEGRYADQVLLRGRVTEVDGRGRVHRLGVPVVVLADEEWTEVELGSRVRTVGQLSPADGDGVAALVSVHGAPDLLDRPGVWWRGAHAVRESVRESVAHRPPSQRELVPALVDGDDSGLDPQLADDFRATGLTHLLAVSGTNLTLVVGFLLVLARWSGVRGRWMYVVGALGIAGFVLLARAEPSVVRAAAMGTVALLAMGTDGRRRGTRALGAAVVTLLLLDPLLAVSVGFALSVCATAGILLLAPGWRDALQAWLPRWLAEAVAIPASAQLTCTPLVAAISGQVSIVAVVANLAVAPAVGPATVLGLSGGLIGVAWPAAGGLVGTLAAFCVGWIVTVARHGARLPTPAVDWGTGFWALAALTTLAILVALAAPYLLRRRSTGLACCCLLVVTVVVRPPTPGWPPTGWVLVACDVGQGDALVLHAGPGAAVVIDAGPDPAATDECLRRLDVAAIPLVLLTHFHADHVDGLSGVLEDRQVGAVETTRLADPPGGVALVSAAARQLGLRPEPAPYGVTRTVGDVRLQVLWPPPSSPTSGPGDGSTANDASVVLLVEVAGLRLLLCGDLEPDAQAALARTWPGLRVDVLKVPHHGSRYQDLPFLLGLGARVAVVSVGEDNDYGHPAASTLEPLAASGAEVLRTDVDGDVAVAVRDAGLYVDSGR
jgi:competence protein ComEC